MRESFIHDRRDSRLSQHLVIDLGGNVWFERPHRIVLRIVPRIAGVVRIACFTSPRGVVLVVAPDAAIEIVRQAADRLFVADVGGAEAAGGEPAEMFRRFDKRNILAHPRGLNRRDDAGRRAAVNDEVERLRRNAPRHEEPRRHDEHNEIRDRANYDPVSCSRRACCVVVVMHARTSDSVETHPQESASNAV
jgi:hypothetical protein